MTTAYYHGSPGSYKTASMVQDWLLPAIKSGRRVLTNIRGVDPSDLITVVPSVSIVSAMFKVQVGTIILIDELGESFRNINVKTARFHDSLLFSEENGVSVQVVDIETLFDKHRHFNLDIIGTAPSIKRVPPDVMAIAEFGFKHKSLGSLGLKGFFLQGQHNGFDTGKSDKEFLSKKIKRINKDVFKYYASTATGNQQGSAVSSPIWKHPVVLVLLLGIAYAVYDLWSGGGINIFKGQAIGTQSLDAPKGSQIPPVSPPDVVATGAPAGSVAPAPLPLVAAQTHDLDVPLSVPSVAVMGKVQLGKKLTYIIGDCSVTERLDFWGVQRVKDYYVMGDNLLLAGRVVPPFEGKCKKSGSIHSVQVPMDKMQNQAKATATGG